MPHYPLSILHRLSAAVQFLLLPVRRNPRFYAAAAVLFSISILFIEYGRCSRRWAVLEMWGDLYLLCTLLMLVPCRLRRWVKYGTFGLLWLTGVADMACYEVMGCALTPNILQTWLQTNPQEAGEALRLYLTPGLLLSPVGLLLAEAGWLLAEMTRRGNRRAPTQGETERGNRRALMQGETERGNRCALTQGETRPRIIGCALLALIIISAVAGFNNKRYLWQALSRTSDDDMEQVIDVESRTHEYLPIYRLALSVSELRRFSTMRRHLLANVQHTQIDSCSFQSPLVVLLIGESYNRHHASLYGYPLPTTPRQERLYAAGRLVRFTDVIASYNLTFKSFQNMLTLYDYDATGRWYDYPILPALFRRAGYHVSFFSNQNTLDKASAFTDFSEDMFMNNPDISRYMFDVRNARSHPYDLELLSDYRQHRARSSDAVPCLVIFHFMGLHADFSQRYPPGHALFSGADYARPDLDADELAVLAAYDNAIAYNDSVVSAIVDEFAGEESVIVYVPDHGELVYDGCQEMGRNLRHERRYVIPQFDIPFWIYCSPRYEERHPALCRRIRGACDRPFMTDDLPHLLLGLAGIHCAAYNPRRDLIAPQFDSSRTRRIKGEVDYDNVKRRK